MSKISSFSIIFGNVLFIISTIIITDLNYETAIWETDSNGKILNSNDPVFLKTYNSREAAIAAHKKILDVWNKKLNNKDQNMN